MFRHLWLIFAQTVTACIAVWFVVATLKPEWLASRPPPGGTVSVTQSAVPAGAAADGPRRVQPGQL